MSEIGVKWTTEKPTIAGWYWWRVKNAADAGIVRILSNTENPEDPIIQFDNGHVTHLRNTDCFINEWAGPIEMPEEEEQP